MGAPMARNLLKAGHDVALWSNTQEKAVQLAAEAGQSLAFIYRPVVTLNNSSPAALRIALRPAAGALGVEVLKARGGRMGAVFLPVHTHV